MELFHLITLSIAIIVLIGTLTLAGIALDLAAKSTVFPTSSEKCPNGCAESTNDDNIDCVCVSENISDATKCTDVGGTWDAADSECSVTFESTNTNTDNCEKKAWGDKHGLYWDGITNHTAC
jgi:hypothetical protein